MVVVEAVQTLDVQAYAAKCELGMRSLNACMPGLLSKALEHVRYHLARQLANLLALHQCDINARLSRHRCDGTLRPRFTTLYGRDEMSTTALHGIATHRITHACFNIPGQGLVQGGVCVSEACNAATRAQRHIKCSEWQT